MDDDDFWTTYIATTPEQDKDFPPLGRFLFWIVAVVAVLAILVALIH
jgi:hypothetical protein